MPIIPTYRRQERYQAPGVQVQAQGPRRLPQAYENALQEGVTAARAVMKYMTPAVPKKNAKQTAKTAVASSEQKGSASGQTALFAASPQAETNLALRSELAERVGRLAAGGERVKTEDLDDFALSRLQAEPAQTPAVRDYMMFRAAAQADEQRQAQEENLARLQAEETLVRGVGALAPSADVLEEYLSAQVPAFEKRLRDNGADSETARKQTASLRAQTAAQCVRYSLSCGDEQTAAQVLEKYGQTMNPAEREECAQKVRFAAADLYARQLWNRARGETGGSPQARAQWVDKQTANIQNKALRQDVCRTSQTLFKQAEAELHQQQASFYRQMCKAEESEKMRLLNAQHVLSGEEAELARREGGSVSDPEKFNKLYFSSSEKEISNALQKGQLSTQDYYLLQALRHERAAGKNETEDRLLCHGIDLWGKKKGLAEPQAQEAKYAVLSVSGGTDERLAAWRRVKALFEF